MAEVHAGRGYQSHFGTEVHFGLGKHERIDRLTVLVARRGVEQELRDLPVDSRLIVVEGGPVFISAQTRAHGEECATLPGRSMAAGSPSIST